MTVVTFQPKIVGENVSFDPDFILEAAKGQGFKRLVIIGELEDGLWTSGTDNLGNTIILIERAKHDLLFPSED